ncbi:MFS transporter [Fangia hongkongensis]|nr:MFS transporter [Fangia hongkongensis]
MANQFMHDFHVDTIQLGFMASIYFIPYVLMQLPYGLLSDKLGIQLLMLIACSITGGGCILFSTANSYHLILFARFIMGFGASASTVCMVMMTNHWFGGRYFAVMVGIGQLFGNAGSMFGDIPVSISITHIGWNQTVFILGIIGLVIACLSGITVRDNPNYKSESYKNSMSIWMQLVLVLKNHKTYWISIYVFCLWTGFSAFAGLWGVSYLTCLYHISTTEAGSTIAIMWGASALGSVVIGWLSSKMYKRKLFLIISAVVGLVSFLVIVSLSKIPFIAMCLLLFLAGLSSSGQALSFAYIKDINPTPVVGTASGLNNMMVMLGSIFIDPFIGYLLKHLNQNKQYTHGTLLYSVKNYQHAFIVVPILFMIAIFISLFLKDPAQKVL